MHGSIMMFLFAGPVRVRAGQLPRAAADRRARHGVPPAQRALVLALPRRRPDHALRASSPPAARPTSAGPPTPRCPTRSTRRASGGDLWIVGRRAHRPLRRSSPRSTSSRPCSRMRAPGMTMFRMPIFTWNMLVTSVLVLLAFPVLTAALAMLFADRHFGGHFFDAGDGRRARPVAAPVLVLRPPRGVHPRPAVLRGRHRGHPGVLAAAGVRLQGPRLRHARDRARCRSACGRTTCSPPARCCCRSSAALTLLIAVPTGVKFFNWIGTMWGGHLVRDADAVRPRVPAHVPDRRPDRRDARRRRRSTST